MISPERLEARQQGFVRLLAPLGVAPGDAYPAFDALAAAWSEPHRHYHDLRHLDEVLRVVGKLRDYCADPTAVELAAWFHDAVYDPRGKDNEARSADLAAFWLGKLRLPNELIGRVADMVRATTHTEGFVTRDAAVLLDADLAILGAAEFRYRQYAAAIRQEYAWVPEADYRSGRRAVLESFLRRNRIYRTERLYEAGEEAARANLRRECDELSA